MITRAMPEAYALKRVAWQLFVTLTFRDPPKSRSSSLPRVFRWLRYLADHCGIYFPALLWVVRFEVGSTGGQGHYHLLIAGIAQALLTDHFRSSLTSEWRACGGGLAEVMLYDPARNGVEYVLKLPSVSAASGALTGRHPGTGGDDCEPMLSKALLQALRRGLV